MQLPSQVQNLQRCRSVSPLRGCLSAPLRSGMYVLVPRGSTPGCHDVRVGRAIPASGAAYVHVVQRSINPRTRPDRVRPRFTTRMPPVHARLWVIYCACPPHMSLMPFRCLQLPYSTREFHEQQPWLQQCLHQQQQKPQQGSQTPQHQPGRVPLPRQQQQWQPQQRPQQQQQASSQPYTTSPCCGSASGSASPEPGPQFGLDKGTVQVYLCYQLWSGAQGRGWCS